LRGLLGVGYAITDTLDCGEGDALGRVDLHHVA
jgi:hypothetical protein